MSRQEEPLAGVTPYLAAWRTLRLGNREFVDGLIAAAHQGPDGALAVALEAWPGAHYWVGAPGRRLVLVRPLAPDRPPRWWLHGLLLALTILCALGAGAALAGAWFPWSGRGLLGALQGAGQFVAGLVQGDWRYLLVGWSFALPLLAILLVHEMGHFLAARRYALQASPPYFLPIPPNLSPIGSLGAYIALRSAVLDRRQLLDVGAAGPLAGFVVALAVLAWGYLTSERVETRAVEDAAYVLFAGQPIVLGQSLLTGAMQDWLVPGPGAVHLSLPGFAGWVGAFLTGLNLLPLSQLDGGHVLYGLLGRRQALVGIAAVIGLLYLAQFTWMWYLWVVAALLIGRGRWAHPSVLSPGQPVPATRRLVGLACVLVFVITFVPMPFGR